MIDSADIYRKAIQIQKKYSCADLVQTAQELGICVKYSEDYKNLLGMYVYRWKCRFIFLNGNLDEVMSRMVLAHEIGHDRLHKNIISEGILKEFTLFDITSKTEYEANAFAAHLLIPDEDILSLATEGFDIMQISQRLNVNVNLTLIKFQELNRLFSSTSENSKLSEAMRNLPFEPDSKFFSKLKKN